MRYLHLLILTFAVSFAMSDSLTAQTGAFVYDWSTASASPSGLILNGNDNWSGSGVVNDDIIRNAGHPDGFFSGNYYTSTSPIPGGEAAFVSLYTRENDGVFSFSIPANAETVNLSFVLQANENVTAARFGLQGSRVVNFGVFGPSVGIGEWGVRQVEDGPGGFGVTGSNGTGAARLDSTLRSYRANLSLDLTAPGTLKSVDLIIDNLTDGGSEIIFDDLPFELGAEADPSQWDTLYQRSATTSIDDLKISFAVPEPTSLALLGFIAGFACLQRSRRRTSPCDAA